MDNSVNLWAQWARSFFDDIFQFFNSCTFTAFGGTFSWGYIYLGVLFAMLICITIRIILKNI